MTVTALNGWSVPQPPHNSLGPSDPTWLAKLSSHLGVPPGHTLAPLLYSIWPDADAASMCCREACALLMQGGSGILSRSVIEDKLQRALSRRRHTAVGVWATLQTDPHFVMCASGGTEESVRLDKGSIPAPAVASLYVPDGSGACMLGAEKALHHAAVHLTWPHAMTDDDAYLCCFISELLLSADEQGSDRQLPRHSMHLTEVGGALRQRSDSDGRLATIFPKGQIGRTKRPRLSEFLCKDELKPFFSVQESRVRQSEKVVTLRMDVLLRALGPLAGLLQKAFASLAPKPLEAAYGEQTWGGSDSNTAAMSVGTSLTPLLEGDLRTPAPELPEQIDGCITPADSGGTAHRPTAHSLFHGVNLAAEVPESIRNCWSDAGGSPLAASARTATPAIAIPLHPTPDKLRPGLASELGRIGDHAPPHHNGANPQGPSTMVSFTSEEVSDALGLVGGASWHRPPTDDAASMQRTTSHFNGASRGLGGDSIVNSPSLGSQYGSMWGGHSMWSGGVIMDSAQHDPVVDSLGARVPSSQAFSEHSQSHTTATWTAPAPRPPSNGSVPITPGSAVSSFSSRPFAPSSAPPPAATNYAAVLRATASATPGASASTAATPSPLQAPPSRHTVAAETDSSDGPSPDENCSAAHAAILSQLDPAARELCSLLWPPWTDHVLMLAQKGLNKPSAAARGGHTRAEVNQAFLAAINACVAAKAPLAGLLDRASAHARKQLMLVSSAGAHALASTSPGLVSLKPQVRKEVNALLEQHRGVLYPEHFDSGVICHLQRRSEAAAAAALREIGRRTDFSAANNKPAYLTHWLMKLAAPDDAGRGAASAAALRVSSQQPDLRKLTRATAAAIEKLVDSSPWIEWRHFDAGVMKVLQQLAASSEADALAEVRQVEVSELSSVKNMPAYLNKCFNNRLWKVRY